MASSSASGTKADNNTQQEQGDDKIAQEVVLQKHAGFFDRNHDGFIYPWETYQGMRAIGSGIMLSLAAAIIVNITLSLKTRSGKFPNLLFPIEIKNIHRAKHGSDTDAFDSEGRFDPVKFEEIFTKHAHTYPNALTKKEMKELMKANREPKDFNGWLSAFGEWPILYSLAKDENGLLQKETVRAVYDGSLFERLEKEHLASKKKK